MQFNFGDAVTNVCAGESNPQRHGYFVRQCGEDIEMTDRHGHFWKPRKTVVFHGHLEYAECERLYAPIHAERFGR
jgi:hypothetical protein